MTQQMEQPLLTQYDDSTRGIAYMQSWLDNVYLPCAHSSASEIEGHTGNTMSLPRTPTEVPRSPLLESDPANHMRAAGVVDKDQRRSPLEYVSIQRKPRTLPKGHSATEEPRRPISRCSNKENVPPATKLVFEKRRRHKTREDRYDTKRQKKSKTGGRPLSRQQRRAEKQKVLKSRKEVMKNFSSNAIGPSSITLKPNLTSSLFFNGRGSEPAPLADLTFNGAKFATLSRNDEIGGKPATAFDKNKSDMVPTTPRIKSKSKPKRKSETSMSRELSLFIKPLDSKVASLQSQATSSCADATRRRPQKISGEPLNREVKNNTSPISWSSSPARDMHVHDCKQLPIEEYSKPKVPRTSDPETPTTKPALQYADKAVSPINTILYDIDSTQSQSIHEIACNEPLAQMQFSATPHLPYPIPSAVEQYHGQNVQFADLELSNIPQESLINYPQDCSQALDVELERDRHITAFEYLQHSTTGGPPRNVYAHAVFDPNLSSTLYHSRYVEDDVLAMRAFWRPNLFM